MRVIVCGSRGWTNLEAIEWYISRLPADAIVIHGGSGLRGRRAPYGADAAADFYARKRGLTVRIFWPDWATHGKRAGIVRNLEMLDEDPELVLAFWDGASPGTRHMISAAQERGIPVEVIRP